MPHSLDQRREIARPAQELAAQQGFGRHHRVEVGSRPG